MIENGFADYTESRINPAVVEAESKVQEKMNRCMDCDGLLMKEETVCQICGAVVPQAHQRMDAAKVITRAVQGLFVVSIAAAVMGLFSDVGPGFGPSILLCCALMIVARSLKDRPESVPSAKRK